MKPISIRFQCFGPYRKEMFVDFEELEKKGLFLICGETGAGKTTILDAMCYALYGKSSGGLRGDLSVMRCKSASQEEETKVEFTFDVEGKRYLFTRTLRYGRKNLMDFHNCFVLEEGNYIPIFENPKIKNVNQKAEELVGLNYEQFRQVIILPQGQFEKLLVSDSAEKEKILVSLFKAEKWQIIADELYERVMEEDRKLKNEIADIRSRLGDYKCDTVEELRAQCEAYLDELREIERTAQKAEQVEKEQKALYENTLLVTEQFTELEKRRRRLAELQVQELQMKRLEQKLVNADEAEVLRPFYEKYKEAAENYENLKKRYGEMEERLRTGREMLQKVEEKKAAHEAGKAGYEAGIKRLTLWENARVLYASLEEKKTAVNSAETHFSSKKKQYEINKTAFEKAHAIWIEQMEVQKMKMETYTSAQKMYLEGISGTLAEKLVAGEPCPVCGSTEHPIPAKVHKENVTEKELDTYNKEMQNANRAVEAAAKKREEASGKYETAQSEAKEAEQKYVSLRTAYEEALRQKIEGIETVKQLEENIADLKQRISKYEELSVRLQNSLNDTKAKVQAAEANLEQMEEELKTSEILKHEKYLCWKEKLEKSIFEDEQRFSENLMSAEHKNQQKNIIFSFKTNLETARISVKEQEEKLKDAEVPNMQELKMKLEEASGVQKRAEKEKILGQQYLEKMQNDTKSLSARKEKHDRMRMEVDKNLEFANRLRGRSGISLQRYVLGVMLSSITVEANRLLKNVHKGRYQLYRTDAISGSGRKGGLELEVLDTQNNERRSVTTLSGGEKFLVALSLAIGLSTVVQAQGKGMRLGAMFIDEGFCSLDENSVYDALEVLQGIQKANGLVGIISHVELLREVIPGKIEVHKGKDGSWF